MNVKNYRGKTAEECMKKLKSELGSDAVILQSRAVKPLFGRFGRSMHEIVAASDTGAVLDKLAERAGERRVQGRENSDYDLAEALAAKSAARLALSNGAVGNTALAAHASPVARRERLTLAEAAELHEQGAYDRLVAAGVLQSKAAQPNMPLLERTGLPAPEPALRQQGEMEIVYSTTAQKAVPNRAAQGQPMIEPAPADDRIAKLEKQIALLATALRTRTESTAQKAVEPRERPKENNEAISSTVVPALPSRKTIQESKLVEPEPVAAQHLAQAAESPQRPMAGLGGFLRYRLPAQNADKPQNLSAEATDTRHKQNSQPAKRELTATETLQQQQYAASPAETDKGMETLPVNAALPYLKALRSAQLAEPLLRRISAEVPPDVEASDAKETVHNILTQRMLIGGAVNVPASGKITLAALLGPTGVGKTTTIAKLAATLSLSGKCRVAMVTLDTSRVAAAEQLKGYGEAMNIPVRVAYDRAELEAILMDLAREKTQVVLIDTPGRGPMETLSLAEMSQSLRAIADLQSYVVVPAPLSASNFENTIQRFIKIAKPNALILTKMDETADNHCLGFLLNAQAKYHLPLAYVTMGGRVPDDLLIADAHLLVNKLMSAAF